MLCGACSEGVSRSYDSEITFGYDDDGLPLNPTRRIWSEHQAETTLGEVHALSGSIHTTHANCCWSQLLRAG